MSTHLSFRIGRKSIVDRILIPKFYDPELKAAAELAARSGYELKTLEELLLPGVKGSQLGSWIPRKYYGTGTIPFVRTSDLSNWRIRADYKKGVAESVYDRVKSRQDVRPNDLLMVAHGSYLIGTVGIVSELEPQLVLQDHVFRLRVDPERNVHPFLLLAALSTSFVRRQVRSRQFSADIIDKIGERHLGILVPLPKSQAKRAELVSRVAGVLKRQTIIRGEIVKAAQSDMRMTRERAAARHSFRVRRGNLSRRILIPKYYDPVLEADLKQAEEVDSNPWVTIGSLVSDHLITIRTGIEVGKMAYGTGNVPFLRTSDLADWAVKRNVRQGVSSLYFDRFKKVASIQEGDVLLVRDGTYLVGTSAIVCKDDVPGLFCAGIYRIRSTDPIRLDPNSLLALLNLPLVRRQFRAKQFTRDVIDTLGPRLLEVRIPSPYSKVAIDVGKRVSDIMRRTAEVKKDVGEIIDLLEPPSFGYSNGRPGWSMR